MRRLMATLWVLASFADAAREGDYALAYAVTIDVTRDTGEVTTCTYARACIVHTARPSFRQSNVLSVDISVTKGDAVILVAAAAESCSTLTNSYISFPYLPAFGGVGSKW